MMMKRLTAFTLLVGFVLTLIVACDSKPTDPIEPDIQLTNVYQSHELSQPEGYRIDSTQTSLDTICVSYIKNEPAVSQQAEAGACNQVVYTYDLKGGVTDRRYLTSGTYEALLPCEDGSYYAADTASLSRLSAADEVIWRYSLTDHYAMELTGAVKLYFDHATDYLYALAKFTMDNRINTLLVVLTDTGEAVQTLYLDNAIGSNAVLKGLFKTPDDAIVLAVGTYTNDRYYRVDLETATVEAYSMPSVSGIIGETPTAFYRAKASDAFDLYYAIGSGLYGYQIEAEHSEMLVNWTNSDIVYSNADWKLVR